ncbi:hypothetical protein TNCV_4297891 [Trichonephila clavipes]|nr:hypothetical protein TNCV_4297891 [Trichonephila clavipes]
MSKTLPWPARSPDSSPVEHIWDHLGRRVGYPPSVKDLKTRDLALQQTEKHFLKLDTNSERSVKLQKQLRSDIFRYYDVYQHLTNQPSSQSLITYFMVSKEIN